MNKGKQKLPHFIEIHETETDSDIIVNVASIYCVMPTDEGCKLLVPKGYIPTTEPYEGMRKLLGFKDKS